jgi:hypothetical protein
MPDHLGARLIFTICSLCGCICIRSSRQNSSGLCDSKHLQNAVVPLSFSESAVCAAGLLPQCAHPSTPSLPSPEKQSTSVESRTSAGADAEATPRFPSPSRPGEFRPEPLTDPCLTVSGHTARVTRGRLAPSAETIGFLLLPVDPCRSRLGDPPPFAPRELPRLIATTEQSAPARHIGTVGLAGLPLGPSPLASPTRFSSSVRKPV